MLAAIVDRLAPWLKPLALVVAFAAGWAVNGWRWEAKQQAAVAQAEAAVKTACKQAQTHTEEVSNALQKQLKIIRRSHAADVKRLRDACAVPVTAPAGGHDAAAPGDGLPRPHPVAALDLLDLARVADEQTAQLMACQAFVRGLHEPR